MKRIGELVNAIGISADTLRYYEKIKLLTGIERNSGGVRYYSEKDCSRLRFVKRAQKMGFSLEEIRCLLVFRDNPQKSKPKVREMAHQKLEEIEHQLSELGVLRDELQLLTSLCHADTEGCPIIEGIDE